MNSFEVLSMTIYNASYIDIQPFDNNIETMALVPWLLVAIMGGVSYSVAIKLQNQCI